MSSKRVVSKRVVIYRLGSLGDTVVALPCLHTVAQTFPNHERIVLTNVPVSSKAAPLEGVLGGSGLVHGFMAYPVGTRSFTELARLRGELRALGADTLVYLTPARGRLAAWRDLAYFRLCGFTRIVGVPLSADLQHNRQLADGTVERESARLARCVQALGPVTLDDPGQWDLHINAAEHEAATAALAAAAGRPRIAINMGGKVVENDWGEANWLALGNAMQGSCGDHALVFIGAAEDHARAGRLAARWPGPAVNLCGAVSPRVSAAAMAGSRLFIGHDSGPLHLAAAMRVRCVGLYGDKNQPRKWHPCGSGHHVIHDMHGVQAITVAQVLQGVQDLLAAVPLLAGAPAAVEAGSQADSQADEQAGGDASHAAATSTETAAVTAATRAAA